jgi:hypothetical protein
LQFQDVVVLTLLPNLEAGSTVTLGSLGAGLLTAAIVAAGGNSIVDILRSRQSLTRIAAGVIMATLGALVVRPYIWTLGALCLKLGRFTKPKRRQPRSRPPERTTEHAS